LLQIVSQKGIKRLGTIFNLAWAYIFGYLMHHSVALLYAARKRFILLCVCLLHNWQAYICMQ